MAVIWALTTPGIADSSASTRAASASVAPDKRRVRVSFLGAEGTSGVGDFLAMVPLYPPVYRNATVMALNTFRIVLTVMRPGSNHYASLPSHCT